MPRRQDFGRAPTGEEDPLNAFIRICRVDGAVDGPLSGQRVAIKDSIAVAGIPMTNASRMLPTYTPLEDAVVVERLLAAGATIVGKTNLEDMALGLGEGSVYGATRNALNPRFAPGGSSTGSAAAVAGGMADIGIGADEAGSLRIPAAWSGLVGMKPTHGLVPSYGLTYMDHSLDHIGPITRTVADNATVLEIIAGGDWRDPQWVRDLPVPGGYVAALDGDVGGLRVAVISESLEPAGATSDVLAAFEDACDRLRQAGAVIEIVSVPLWSHAWAIESAVLGNGLWAMASSGGAGFGHKGRINVSGMEHAMSQIRNSGNDFALLGQLLLLLVEHDRDQYLGIHYGKAQNLRLELRRQVNDLLAHHDVLVTPTTPTVATELATDRVDPVDMIARLVGNSIPNTCPLDLTGNPAISVPCGTGDNQLPVGFQVVGRDFDEAATYRVATHVEKVLDRAPQAGAR